MGLFDFSDAPVRCMQYLVSLLCEEKVNHAELSSKPIVVIVAIISFLFLVLENDLFL